MAFIEQESGTPGGAVIIRKIRGEMRAPVAPLVDPGTVLDQQQPPGVQAANVKAA